MMSFPTGCISSKPSYVFYQKEGNGAKYGELPADKVIIYEQERNDGLVKAYKAQFVAKWHYFFGIPLFIGQEVKYSIFIPKGGIKHDFQVDLK